ncbi:MAG: transcriptional repressor NrdR [Nanoarchaeota archaeon]|nr:transcriptional repressor NrdR [Nanoarchaeota archaeon]
MKCLYCRNPDTKVTDSRISDSYVRRRRECLQCNKRFTTYERTETDLMVIKKDNSKQLFDKNKILNGLTRACNKRLTEQEIQELANKIENKILNLNKVEIKSAQLGNLVMKELKKADPVAYVRFASVCKSFDNITHFEKEIKELGGIKK